LAAPTVEPGDTEPATPARRYSVTMVRGYVFDDGTTSDVVVMRGDLAAVLGAVKTRHEASSIVRRKAQIAILRGWRALAVATARVGDDDEVGPFTLQGFVALRPDTGTPVVDADIASGPAVWARVTVWSPSLRIQHWSNVAIVFILSLTGFYIMDPFFGPDWRQGEASGYLMGIMRFIHFTAAFVWLVVGLTRIWSAFTSSDRYLRWSSLWPLKTREDLRNLGRTIQHYTFLKTEAPVYLGHNPLQQLTYTAVYLLCGVQLVIGFVLYSLYHVTNPFWALVSTPSHWLGIGPLRLVHASIMFLLWAFVIVHVYLVFRADSVERHGGLSAMVNGGVWVKRGTNPADAPVVE
jgi:Ni/Fe-hydrogenase b-type cytochrome subunit